MLGRIFTATAIVCGILVIGLYFLTAPSRPSSPPGDPRNIQIPPWSSPTSVPAHADNEPRAPAPDPIPPTRALTDAAETATSATDAPSAALPSRVELPPRTDAVSKSREQPAVRAKPARTVSEKERLARAQRERSQRELARAEELRRVRHFYEWQWRPEVLTRIRRPAEPEESASAPGGPIAEAPATGAPVADGPARPPRVPD